MVIDVQDLTKIFKNSAMPWKKKQPIVALDKVTLKVQEGEVFGLLGPNGSGKTTLIRCLIGLVRPTSGSGTVFGFKLDESDKIRKRSSLLPQEASCYENLTARENILYFGGIHGSLSNEDLEKRTDSLIELIGLKERQNDLTKEFSGGMKRKVLVARALVMNPDLVFLDEPTTAIDILGARVIRTLVKRLSTEYKKTIFLTTHDLAEVHELCDRVGIISKGKLVATGKPNELQEKFSKHGLEDVYTGLVTGELDFE